MIVSDGGPQFTSQEFKLSVENWGITHITSSPMYQRANGRAESAVKIMKTLVKTYEEGGDPYEAMLEQRNTPRQDTGRSPVEMMFNRRTRSFLPGMGKNSPKDTLVKEKREARRCSVKKAHNRKPRKLSEIDVGQSVFFQHTEGQNWKLGKFTDILGPHTYQVSGPNGGMYRRNRVHMRTTKVIPKARDLSPVIKPHGLDVTPLTLPVEDPQACYPPAGRPVKSKGKGKVTLFNVGEPFFFQLSASPHTYNEI